jgi:hypothetical protein
MILKNVITSNYACLRLAGNLNKHRHSLTFKFVKFFGKKGNSKTKKQTFNDEIFDEPQLITTEDRSFDNFIKNEESARKEKENQKEKVREKRNEGLQCLVLHPVFLQK